MALRLLGAIGRLAQNTISTALKASSNNKSSNSNSSTSSKSTTTTSNKSKTSTSSSKSSSNKSSSSNAYKSASNDFDTKYANEIRGIADYNNVDLSVGKEMFTANLNNALMGIDNPNGAYKGGGVVDSDRWNEMVNDWSNLKNEATKSASSKTTRDSYGREVSGSDLIDPNYTGMLGAINRASGNTSNTNNASLNQPMYTVTQQPYIINQGINQSDFNNMMSQMGTQFGNALASVNNNLSDAIMNMGQSFGSSLNNLASTLGGLSFATRGINGEEVYKTGRGTYLATLNGKAIEISESDYINWMIQLTGF